MLFRAAPWLTTLQASLQLLQAVLPALIFLSVGRFIIHAQTHAWAATRTDLLMLAAVIALGQVAGPIGSAFRLSFRWRFGHHIQRLMMKGVTDLPGLAHIEDEVFQRKVELVRTRIGYMPSNLVQSVFAICGAAVQAITLGVTAASYFSWWAPLLVAAAAVPAAMVRMRFSFGQQSAIWSGTHDSRHAMYAKSVAMQKEAAKEIRISPLGEWLADRKQRYFIMASRPVWAVRRKGAIWGGVFILLQPVALAIVTFSMLSQAQSGGFLAGRYVIVFGGLSGCMLAVSSIFDSLIQAREYIQFLPVAFEVMEAAGKDPRLTLASHPVAMTKAKSGITFSGVHFTYPKTTKPILNGLDLHIPAGSSIALVGENGAGKTTLIKLLCRFYDPDQGSITLDGVDIREYELAEYRRRLAVIFQDFSKYSVPAHENLAVGAINHYQDIPMARRAARRIGILDKLDALPKGLDTILDRQFEGGADLSGGEWQRLSLGRALMGQEGHGADVLILDEPTASLDVRTEHELYERFDDLTKDQTTILVSHRFSTVRMASRVIYMEGGQVVEDGSHDELIRRRGRYAELYELQAMHFRETGVLD